MGAAGAYVRIPSKFHNHVTKDGSSGWPAEKNRCVVCAVRWVSLAALTLRPSGDRPVHRYHLLVSHACPWAHRTVMTRLLKVGHPAVSMAFGLATT